MRNSSGFTLIEVLVALAIVSIALTAIIKSTSQNIRDTHYLQQKVIATWVATRTINEARAQLIRLSISNETFEETEILGQSWTTKIILENTPNPQIQKIHVSVFHKGNEQEIAQLTGYLYAQT